MTWPVPDGVLDFAWAEAGGPQAAEPSPPGFGSRLVEGMVGARFDGEGRIDFAPEGARFRLTGAARRSERVA